MYKILIVDDELHIRELLKDYLEHEGFHATTAEDGQTALDLLETESFDLMLLDVRMPKMNGFEVLKYMRTFTDMPVLFLTALGDTHYEVQGLEIGADDYIRKPFEYHVLMARIQLVLRKAGKLDRYVMGEVTLNVARMTVTIGAVSCDLRQKEFELLKYLMAHPNQVMKRLQILDAVWGLDFEGDPRTLDTHIKTLRSKLGQWGHLIKTIRGVGYVCQYEATK